MCSDVNLKEIINYIVIMNFIHKTNLYFTFSNEKKLPEAIFLFFYREVIFLIIFYLLL